MMPYEIEPPAPGFLNEARELAHSHGALVVFDEVRSGFRLALGGAQQYFGANADLVALSKAMGNGFPISAVGGSAMVLSSLRHISHSSSFFRSADGAAAALATITELERRAAIPHTWELGRRLMDGLARASAREGVVARPVGLPPMPFQSFELPPQLELFAQRLFCNAARESGVLFHPTHHWFMCDAMSNEDIDHAVDAAGAGYRAVAAWKEKIGLVN
jgi:glutamate-1-semialdehyde aminotransferase